MSAFSRKPPGDGVASWPDRRPPPLPRTTTSLVCVSCGQLVIAPDERMDGEPVRHMVCDAGARRALARRIEASRVIHRLLTGLGSVASIRDRVKADVSGLPDACDVSDALALVARTRTLLECSPDLTAQQRRVALSFVDATARRLMS